MEMNKELKEFVQKECREDVMKTIMHEIVDLTVKHKLKNIEVLLIYQILLSCYQDVLNEHIDDVAFLRKLGVKLDGL